MSVFTIDHDNNITAYATVAEAKSNQEAAWFASAKELGEITAKWPSSRLVEIWNSLPGQKPVKKFTDRKVAVLRIWEVIQHLTPVTAAPAKVVASKQQKLRKQATEGAEAAPARADSKTSQVLDLLKRPGGAALQQIMAVTNWQAHSMRGFLSGTLRKKMGLTVVSEKGQNGDRMYSIK